MTTLIAQELAKFIHEKHPGDQRGAKWISVKGVPYLCHFGHDYELGNKRVEAYVWELAHCEWECPLGVAVKRSIGVFDSTWVIAWNCKAFSRWQWKTLERSARNNAQDVIAAHAAHVSQPTQGESQKGGT